MLFIKKKNHNFYFGFFEKNKVPEFYQTNEVIPESYLSADYNLENTIHIIKYIPPYLMPNELRLKEGIGSFSKEYCLGYAMYLDNFSDVDEYLRSRFSKKTNKNLRQDYNRLKREHSITLKIYYGEMDPYECKELLAVLKEFITTRFDELNKAHYALTKWDFYEKTVYQKVLDKNASLYVLYNADKPIAISLCYHFKNIMISDVTSFDGAYFTYSLGKIMFVEQLKWGFENGVSLLDTGWGEFPYKMKFSNAVYRYKHQVLYPKNNMILKLRAMLLSWILMAKSKLATFKKLNYRSERKAFEGRWLEKDKIIPTEPIV